MTLKRRTEILCGCLLLLSGELPEVHMRQKAYAAFRSLSEAYFHDDPAYLLSMETSIRDIWNWLVGGLDLTEEVWQ